jgi:hypothetical protein
MRSRLLSDGIKPSHRRSPPLANVIANAINCDGDTGRTVARAAVRALKGIAVAVEACEACASLTVQVAGLAERVGMAEFSVVELDRRLRPRQQDSSSDATYALRVAAERRRLGLG